MKKIILTGLTFGKWTVLEEAPKIDKSTRWVCLCECGTTKNLRYSDLVSGSTTSCGCTNDLTGKIFGRWEVLHRVDNGVTPKGKPYVKWFCRCLCGTEGEVTATGLRSGKSRSCGCLARELISARSKANFGLRKPIVDLTGKKFGRLTVIRPTDIRMYKSVAYACVCDCGNTKLASGKSLQSGDLKSCGCLHADVMRLEKSGKNSCNYKPDKTDEERELGRHIAGYHEWRLSVYIRDNFTCQCCGTVRDGINAHHLEDYASNRSLRLEVSNGVTLCAKCHMEFHSIYGTRGRTYTWQFCEFINTRSAGNEY